MSPLNQESIIFAYIEEPPFVWTGNDGLPTGCDAKVVFTILERMEVKDVVSKCVTFPDLLTGVAEGQWTINTPMFITPERSERVQYSYPVWVLRDGFMVNQDMDLSSYEALAQDTSLGVGVVRQQVQHQRALDAGIAPERIQIFEMQEDVVASLLAGEVDVYIATSMGHRAYIDSIGNDTLSVIELNTPSAPVSFGAYSFSKSNTDFVTNFNEALANYIGSAEHRSMMLGYGFSDTDIDLVLAQY